MSAVDETAGCEASPPHTIMGMVDGDVGAADNADRLAIINPDTGEPAYDLLEDGVDEVAHAAARARHAFEEGRWARTPPAERAACLRRVAALIRTEARELALADCLSTGLSLHRSLLPHTEAAAGWFEYFADLIDVEGDLLQRRGRGEWAQVTREPVGVCALFTPWNIPLMCAALKLSAALAMGNSCVLKPSEQSPAGAARLAELLIEAGVPPGVVNLVNGRGEVTGAALAKANDVDAVSFTGGETAGRAIAQAAMARFAKVTLELGGKSATIIYDDADYDAALTGALAAAYGNSGQACLAGSRLLVQRGVADRFIADFAARTKAMTVGRPTDENADLGPLITEAHMHRVLAYASTVAEDGGEVLAGGGRAAGFARGNYVEPIVAMFSETTARAFREEIFGPFASFLVFDDEDDAVRIANDTRYGLAGYVWSTDLNRALRTADRLRTGYVMVNSAMRREKNAPFGGFGHSGLGREGGRWSLDFYSEAKTTVVVSPDRSD